ncbi:PP2C family protein-serine/threonine phosphatase [Nocardia sp. NPDC057668]|uniref:PP2C family protein-serine/threonine phosphatase n=1 Tax=Nocardia sp. NPDC057668 TaxID=3346202 RepID=UPI00366DEF0C
MNARCGVCGAFAAETDRFCEECGRELVPQRIALPPDGGVFAPAAVTLPAGEPALAGGAAPLTGTTVTFDDAAPGPCDGCGGDVFDADGFCAGCGRRPRVRDRFEADLGITCVVTDRGHSHAHNEDAVAAARLTDAGGSAGVVIAVCDGVSSSEDPQAASGAAVRAGVEATLAALSAARPAEEAVLAGLTAAGKAVHDIGTPDGRAPSCTYVSALVLFDDLGGARVTIANVGDSRAYWLRSEPTGSQRLTLDDSLAQELVNSGAMDENAAMSAPHAHVLTRWLGADNERHGWSPDCVRTTHIGEPGVLLLCSDGLWNYLPEPADLARIATGGPPVAASRALVDYALQAGGKDNITVALVPVPFSERVGDAP